MVQTLVLSNLDPRIGHHSSHGSIGSITWSCSSVGENGELPFRSSFISNQGFRCRYGA